MLPVAREVGLTRVEITTDTDNTASQRVIEANRGRLAGEFVNPHFGTKPKLRYVIDLAGQWRPCGSTAKVSASTAKLWKTG